MGTPLSELGRHVSAGFAELAVPLINDPRLAQDSPALELSLAGRYERYSDFGSTFNGKTGISWRVLPTLTLRGTWGTSFKAPQLYQVDTTNAQDYLTIAPDPQSQTGSSVVLVRQGTNANLRQETATTWAAGLDFQPSKQGPSISVSYYNIAYKNRIQPGGPSDGANSILLDGQLWAPLIERNPTPAQISAICNGPYFTAQPPALCNNFVPVAIVDLRLLNLATETTQGIDLLINQTIHTAYGTIALALNGNRTFSQKQQVIEGGPTVDVVNSFGNPVSLRVRGSASWTYRGFDASVMVNYEGRYTGPVSAVNGVQQDVASWTTVDLNLSYRIGTDANWLSNTSVALNVINLLDRSPPFANTALGFDEANANPYGRIVSLQVIKGW